MSTGVESGVGPATGTRARLAEVHVPPVPGRDVGASQRVTPRFAWPAPAGATNAHAGKGSGAPLLQACGHAMDVETVMCRRRTRGDVPRYTFRRYGQGPHGGGGLGPTMRRPRPDTGGGRFPRDLTPEGTGRHYRPTSTEGAPSVSNSTIRIAGVQDVAGSP